MVYDPNEKRSAEELMAIARECVIELFVENARHRLDWSEIERLQREDD